MVPPLSVRKIDFSRKVKSMKSVPGLTNQLARSIFKNKTETKTRAYIYESFNPIQYGKGGGANTPLPVLLA